MANIITRAGKGAPLSWNEADANFINLNNDKVETSILANYSTTVETDASIVAALSVHIDDAIDAHVSSAIGYLPAGTGAVATDVQSKLRESVSVKDFGAVGDWDGDTGTDDTEAIRAAITHSGQTGELIYFPAGRYLVTSPINVSNAPGKTFAIAGVHSDSSEILLNTGGDGITLNVSGSWWSDLSGAQAAGVRISNIRFSTNNSGVGTGLSIVGDSIAGRPRSPIVLEYIQLSANGGMSNFWETGTSIIDAGMVVAIGCKWTASTTLPSRGLYLDGTDQATSPVHFKITNCEFTYGGKQIELGDFVEGVYITGCTLIAGEYAVYWAPSQGESGLHVANCHMSSALSNVFLNNVFDFNLSGSLFYRSGTASNYYGVRLLNVGTFAINGNVFLGKNSGTFDEYGIYAESSINDAARGGLISGNSFHNYLKRGVWLGANARYINVTESNSYRNCVLGAILNQASVANNTVSATSVKAVHTVALVGGATTEKISIPISPGTFRVKPAGGFISGTGNGSDYTGSYDVEDAASTASNAVFTVRRYGGGVIAAANIRFSYFLFCDEDGSTIN